MSILLQVGLKFIQIKNQFRFLQMSQTQPKYILGRLKSNTTCYINVVMYCHEVEIVYKLHQLVSNLRYGNTVSTNVHWPQ